MPLPEITKNIHGSRRSGTLWMYHMPGLTGSMLEHVAESIGLFVHSQMVNLSKQQWVEFRKACEKKLGIDSTWEDKQYQAVVDQCRREGWGTKYGPGTGGGYKRKGKKAKGGDVEIKIKQNEQKDQEQGRLW